MYGRFTVEVEVKASILSWPWLQSCTAILSCALLVNVRDMSADRLQFVSDGSRNHHSESLGVATDFNGICDG